MKSNLILIVLMELIQKEFPKDHESKETMWIYKENKELFNKYTQIDVKSSINTITKKIEPIEKNQTITKKKETPLDLIIKYTSTTNKMKSEIKEKLIELITIPEFSKAFGLKKSAEVISAITRDSWNQSIALFISFLLEKNVIYKSKSYLYNKEKKNGDIIVK
jgi:hypothetical protein